MMESVLAVCHIDGDDLRCCVSGSGWVMNSIIVAQNVDATPLALTK